MSLLVYTGFGTGVVVGVWLLQSLGHHVRCGLAKDPHDTWHNC